jgi:hypothetical protein
VREPRPPATTDQYERPQQAWTCGLAAAGAPCPAGPTAHGGCPAAAACHPVRDGDRWHCNRSTLRGGPCEEGPSPGGECCIVYRCTPVRSLRVRRGRFVFGLAIAALGALVMALSGSWRNEFLAPGPLSMHITPSCSKGRTRRSGAPSAMRRGSRRSARGGSIRSAAVSCRRRSRCSVWSATARRLGRSWRWRRMGWSWLRWRS